MTDTTDMTENTNEKNGYRILLIEDNDVIAASVAKYLSTWGFSVRIPEAFDTIMTDFANFDPHLVLIDISLPFFNGYYWCEKIRKRSKVPVVFLSSASDNLNIVMAMNMGADDFIAKPFDLGVLLAKVQAILRRTYDFSVSQTVLCHRGATLNTSDASLSCSDRRIDLTKNEYRILLTLFENRGHLVSREVLMEKLWETDSFVDENTLSVNIARLRKKLEGAGLNGFIETKKGMGYYIPD